MSKFTPNRYQVAMVDSDNDIFCNRLCQFHKSSLEYACLERNCYSKIKQICVKCVRKSHHNHQIADISLLVSYVESMKIILIQSAAKFETKYLTIPLAQLKEEYIQIITGTYYNYKRKLEGLIYKIIELSAELAKYEEFDYSSSVLNKAISLVGKMELIQLYFDKIPNKWINQVSQRLTQLPFEDIKELDIQVNFFDHYRFNSVVYKKIQLNLPSYKGLKLTNLGGIQLVIIQSTKLYILELDDNKQRLLTHEVDSKINQVYQYKQQQNLLITCGTTQPILVNNRIFNISNNYLLRVDFYQGDIKILKRVFMKNLKNITQYDNKMLICQINSNSINMLNIYNLKVVSVFKVKYIIDEIICFPNRDEILLFCNEKLICINILTKQQSCISGNYYFLKKKKLDFSHYALWNQHIVEIFDILKSHIKPVVTLHISIIDIEIVQGKIFIIGKDRVLHIYK